MWHNMSYGKCYQLRTTDGQDYGIFRYQRKAEAEALRNNKNRIRNLMIEAHRLTGIKRGQNVEKWNQLVEDISTPFFVVHELIYED